MHCLLNITIFAWWSVPVMVRITDNIVTIIIIFALFRYNFVARSAWSWPPETLRRARRRKKKKLNKIKIRADNEILCALPRAINSLSNARDDRGNRGSCAHCKLLALSLRGRAHGYKFQSEEWIPSRNQSINVQCVLFSLDGHACRYHITLYCSFKNSTHSESKAESTT